jgi:hypothetical protein
MKQLVQKTTQAQSGDQHYILPSYKMTIKPVIVSAVMKIESK